MVKFNFSLRVYRAVFKISSFHSCVKLRTNGMELWIGLVEIIVFLHKWIHKTLILLSLKYYLIVRKENIIDIIYSDIFKYNSVIMLVLAQILKLLLDLHSPILYKFNFLFTECHNILHNFALLIILIKSI